MVTYIQIDFVEQDEHRGSGSWRGQEKGESQGAVQAGAD